MEDGGDRVDRTKMMKRRVCSGVGKQTNNGVSSGSVLQAERNGGGAVGEEANGTASSRLQGKDGQKSETKMGETRRVLGMHRGGSG